MAKTLKEHIYTVLVENKGQFITYQEILESFDGYEAGLPLKYQSSYESAKNIVSDFKEHLKKQGLNFVYKNGRTAAGGFMLPVTQDDPLADLISSHKRMRLKQMERLIKASKGLFPDSWMANFMDKALQTDVEQRPIIGFGQNEALAKLHLVPTFFDAIECNKVLSFTYNPGYHKELVDVVFHPQFMKEYNQRWFVFGKAYDREGKPLKYTNCAIDRILEPVREEWKITYQGGDTDWLAYFKPMVGVSRYGNKVMDIIIETQNAETYARLVTKRIHESQKVLQEHDDSKGQRGQLKISVIPNPELRTLLMSYQEGIKVLSPEKYVDEFVNHLKKMTKLYM